MLEGAVLEMMECPEGSNTQRVASQTLRRMWVRRKRAELSPIYAQDSGLRLYNSSSAGTDWISRVPEDASGRCASFSADKHRFGMLLHEKVNQDIIRFLILGM